MKEKNNNTQRYQRLLDRLVALRNNINQQAILQLSPFARYYPDGIFTPGAINLSQYLVLRQYDLRKLQNELNALGLSSLGRGEEQIVET